MRLQEAAVFCSVIGALLYLNTLDCGYCFDDHSAIRYNLDLRSETPWSQLLQNDFWGENMLDPTSHKSYRPLTVVTFRLNYILHEFEPLGYHLVNVLLHSAVCYLYVLLCGVVFSKVWPALIAGLLFAVHPIHTEAVAGLVGRAELLSSIFFLLTLFCYKKASQVKGLTDWTWFCLSLLMSLSAALSKEQGITVIGLCLVQDFIFCVKIDFPSLLKFKFQIATTVPEKSTHKAIYDSRPLLPPLLPFILRTAALATFTLFFMAARIRIMGGQLPTFMSDQDNPAVNLPSPHRQLTWLLLCFHNCWLLLSPSTLCNDWSGKSIPVILSLSDIRNLAMLTTFVVLITLGLWMIKWNRRVSLLGLSLMVIPFLPASNIFFPVGFVIAERVLYIPSMGFCMLVAQFSWELMGNGKNWMRFIKPGLFFLLILFSTKTVLRNRAWYSDVTLWRANGVINPSNSKVYTNLVRVYEGQNDTEMAVKLLEQAAEIDPTNLLILSNAGRYYHKIGRLKEAEKYLRQAIGVIPTGKKMALRVGHTSVNVYKDLARVLKEDDTRLEEAAYFFLKAISLKDKDSSASEWHMEAGNCFLRLGKLEEALENFMLAVKEEDSPNTNYNLAVVYDKAGEVKLAENHLRRALKLQNEYPPAFKALALILSKSDNKENIEEALYIYKRIAEKEPQDPTPLYFMGKISLNMMNFDAAEKLFKKAISLNPNHVQSIYSLGKLYVTTQEPSQAVPWLEHLIALMPHTTLGTVLLVQAYQQTGQSEKAQKLLSQSPQVTIESAKTHFSIAQVNEKRGELNAAKEQYQRALHYDPNNIEILREFGRFLFQTQQWLEAEKHLSLFLKKMVELGQGGGGGGGGDTHELAAVRNMLTICRGQLRKGGGNGSSIGESKGKTKNDTKRSSTGLKNRSNDSGLNRKQHLEETLQST